MTRPKTTGARFTLDDLAIVGGLTRRQVEQLARAHLFPTHGDVREVRDAKRAASIGAFVAAGAPLLAAAQIVLGLVQEGVFSTGDGEVPSGLDDLARKLSPDELSLLPDLDAFSLHSVLSWHPELYTPGAALPADAVVEIADRRDVIYATAERRGLGRAQPLGRIEGWRRGSHPLFVPVFEIADPYFDPEGGPSEAARALDDEMLAARENAVGLLRVNLSLAIRNGLDRLAERRAKR